MKSGASIPPGQKVLAKEAHCFPAECQKRVRKKATLDRANEVEMGEMYFS